MRTLRKVTTIAFVLLIVFLATTYGESVRWPLNTPIDLSSGFGDYRSGRFHAGLDIRTGGEPGKPVHSPVAGYVLRVKMSYFGYGKGLYVKGDDGNIYVFGHLQRFSESLDRRVKQAQLAQKRYYVELEFPKDSIRVGAGDLLAYSGQTGAGAPHLHFENRTGDNFPLNPLTHGYPVTDKVAPAFTRIAFQMTDELSLFPEGARKITVPVRARGSRAYSYDSMLYFNRPFGIEVDCFDRLRKEGPKLGVYRLSLFIDDRLRYETLLDTVDFATNPSADLVYDFEETADGDNYVCRLYRDAGNNFAGAKGTNGGDGTIGADLAVGRHKVRVVAADASGNRSELTFAFLWGPPQGIFSLDSMVTLTDTTAQYFFTAASGYKELGIDSAVVFLNRRDAWGVPPSISVKLQPDGHLTAFAKGYIMERLLFCLGFRTQDGTWFREQPFNGLESRGSGNPIVTHEVTNQGLIVTASLIGKKAGRARLELYNKGKLLGIEHMDRYYDMNTYRWFVPPRPEYANVDLLAVALSDDTATKVDCFDSAQLAVIGFADTQRIEIDSLASITFKKSGLYGPRFIEVRRATLVNRDQLRLNSDHYQVFPEFPLLKEPFEIKMKGLNYLQAPDKSGLCRLDKKKNRWVWINTGIDGGVMSASSRQGGSIAAVYDFDPPRITDLNVFAGQRVRDLHPVIQFKITDSLSGLADDRSILIKLDGQWQIPEYDPETGICQTQTLDSMVIGNHHLAIEVTDRAGNVAQQYLQFLIDKPLTKASGK